MILLRLSITNFGVFRGRHDFELRPVVVDGAARPLVLFGGKNGSGKTTILEAIRLCLYGRGALGSRVRQTEYSTYIRNRMHRSPAHQIAASSASVGLMFEHVYVGTKHVYDAVRSWRVSGATVSEDISIYKDSVPFQDIAPEHWSDFLRDLIPQGVADLFFFDGEQIQMLADLDRETATLSTAIKGLLNLDLVDRLHGDLSLYLRQQTHPDKSRLDRTLLDLETQRDARIARREALLQDRAQMVAQVDRALAQADRVRQRLVSAGATFVHERDALLQGRKDAEQRIEHTKAALRELAGGLLPFAVTPQWCLRLRDQLQREAEGEREHMVYDSRREQAAHTATALLDPAFQRTVAPQVPIQDWAQIAAAVQGLLLPATPPAVTQRHPIATAERETLQTWITSAVMDVPTRLQALAQQLDALEADVSRIANALGQVPTDAAANPLLDEFRRWSEEKGRLEAELARLADVLRQEEGQLAQVERERSLVVQQLAASGATDVRVQRAAQVQLLLESYRTQITARKIEELEQAIARYFNLLCRKQVLVKEVKIDPRRFTVELYGANRLHLPKEDLSAGERQLYAMALLWALRSVSGRALPIIVDTPMGRLDSEHRATLMEHFFPYAAHQTIVLATDTEIAPAAYRTLRWAVSHVFQLDYDEQAGCTRVERSYFADQPQEVAA